MSPVDDGLVDPSLKSLGRGRCCPSPHSSQRVGNCHVPGLLMAFSSTGLAGAAPPSFRTADCSSRAEQIRRRASKFIRASVRATLKQRRPVRLSCVELGSSVPKHEHGLRRYVVTSRSASQRSKPILSQPRLFLKETQSGSTPPQDPEILGGMRRMMSKTGPHTTDAVAALPAPETPALQRVTSYMLASALVASNDIQKGNYPPNPGIALRHQRDPGLNYIR